MFYLVKTPGWLQKLYGSCTWSLPATDNTLFLTFDDGPHPAITPYVLDELKKFDAKATFFCVGKNVQAYPGIVERILDEGHGIGNHTFSHLDGWKSNTGKYLEDIEKASRFIDSTLFRPPYGRITPFQVRQLMAPHYQMKVIMWTVLSGDFDNDITPEQCLENILLKSESGSILVFHDSDKAFDRMSYALPKMLNYFSKKGFTFRRIPAAT